MTGPPVEPFRIEVADADLDDLRARLHRTRWPGEEPAGDNLSLYWLTRTAASSARLYWESIAEVSAWFTSATTDTIAVPTGCTVFPAEVPRPSRRWAERRFTSIVHWGEPGRGGHFGAWEQPGLFVDELRATRRAVARRFSHRVPGFSQVT